MKLEDLFDIYLQERLTQRVISEELDFQRKWARKIDAYESGIYDSWLDISYKNNHEFNAQLGSNYLYNAFCELLFD